MLCHISVALHLSLHELSDLEFVRGALQDCIAHSEFRESLLVNVWQAFTVVAETAVKVEFQSSIIGMAQLHEQQAAELTATREALTQSQSDTARLEQTLAHVTGAACCQPALPMQ